MNKTRFAPSPTGYLHVGSLRTALYAYLIAKQSGGSFVLRIEDTDQERLVKGGVENIVESLTWAGLEPDEGVKLTKTSTPGSVQVEQIGENGPYIQSQRLEKYKEYCHQLIADGNAYYCFCSPNRLQELRAVQARRKLPTRYDSLCSKLDPKDALLKIKAGQSHVVRMKMPKSGLTSFADLVRGEVKFKNDLLDDQIILKSDGFPTYHLAVVVDDYLMGINTVIRGEEWISSTPKHIQLYKYFGWHAPTYAHLPLLLNPDRTKLSKRQGDISVMDYQKKGYLPQALVNFVAFLGWNPGTEQEIFSLEELAKVFSFSNVSKAGGVFDLKKLDWYNKEYLKKLPLEVVTKHAEPFFDLPVIAQNNFAAVVNLERSRVTTLADLPSAVKFVSTLPDYSTKDLIWRQSDKNTTSKILKEVEKLLTTYSDTSWTEKELQTKLMKWIKEQGHNNGEVLWPVRVALSGQQNSPGPFEIAAVLGQGESLKRLVLAQEKISEL